MKILITMQAILLLVAYTNFGYAMGAHPTDASEDREPLRKLLIDTSAKEMTFSFTDGFNRYRSIEDAEERAKMEGERECAVFNNKTEGRIGKRSCTYDVSTTTGIAWLLLNSHPYFPVVSIKIRYEFLREPPGSFSGNENWYCEEAERRSIEEGVIDNETQKLVANFCQFTESSPTKRAIYFYLFGKKIKVAAGVQ